MNHLNVYHRLPAPARSVVASLRGVYLRAWRYGPETDELTAEALERDSWSRERWRSWQEERLSYVLHRAATRVPYYRELWAARRLRGDRRSPEYLEHWPVLEKEPLRAHPEAFVADDCDPRRMFHEHTSGTTGTPLDLWWSRRTVRLWYAVFEARCRRWYGVSRHERWAIVGGQVVVPVGRRKPPFWVRNVALHQLYMSSYHLAPDLIGHYLDGLESFKPRYLLGYSSSLYEIARGLLDQAHRAPRELSPRVIVTNAEPLLPYQRETIQRAFRCPVRETYGMSEAVAAASECEAGSLHLWPEIGWVEVLSGVDGGVNDPSDEADETDDGGAAGDLVCTGLLNADMPLIRYRVGDRGVRPLRETACPCGRGLPSLAAIQGRSDDILYTRDGRRVGRLDPVFKTRFPIAEAQIIQETIDRIRLRYVPAADFTPAAGRRIAEEIRARLGDVEVVLEAIPSIPRTPTGKFRAVICQIPASDRRSAPDTIRATA